MRKASVLVVVLIAAVLSADALAKEGGVELSSTPAGINSGDPWIPGLLLIDGTPEMLAQAKPGIRIRNEKTGETSNFRAKPTGEDWIYTVRVVFPEAGTYTYVAYDGVTGREYEFPPVTIAAPQVAAPVVPGGSGFPVWPLVAGPLALLAALGGFILVRRRRLVPA
jgi:hypothetical protein